jgi:hypothetical protein
MSKMLRWLGFDFSLQSPSFNSRWLHARFVVVEVAVEHLYLQVSLIFSMLIIILSFLYAYLSLLPEVCNSHDKAAHYHVFGLQVGVFVSDSAFGWLQSQEVTLVSLRSITLRCSSSSSHNRRELCCYSLLLVTWRLIDAYIASSAFSSSFCWNCSMPQHLKIFLCLFICVGLLSEYLLH